MKSAQEYAEGLCPVCMEQLINTSDEGVCTDCSYVMQKRIILICVDHELSENDIEFPYRTGHTILISEDKAAGLFPPGIIETVKERRVTYYPEALADAQGFFFEQSDDIFDASDGYDEFFMHVREEQELNGII